MTGECLCEHEGHMALSMPPVHVYGSTAEVEDVKTPFGTFPMCKPCIEANHGKVEL